jgi:hypothetical protein
MAHVLQTETSLTKQEQNGDDEFENLYSFDPFMKQIAQAADATERTFPSDVAKNAVVEPPISTHFRHQAALTSAASKDTHRSTTTGMMSMDTELFKDVHRAVVSPELHGVKQLQTGRPLWPPVMPYEQSSNRQEELNIRDALKREFDRVQKTYLYNVCRQLGQSSNSYLMMHSHRQTIVRTDFPRLGYGGPFTGSQAKSVQESVISHQKKLDKQLGGNYAYLSPHQVQSGQFYPVIQQDPPGIAYQIREEEKNAKGEDGEQKNDMDIKNEAFSRFRTEYSELALTGLSYHMRRFIKFHLMSLVQKIHMFNVDDEVPSVHVNSIERIRENEQEQYELFCQSSKVTSGEEYTAQRYLITAARDGGEVRQRLEEMFLNREEREKRQKERKEKEDQKTKEQQEQKNKNEEDTKTKTTDQGDDDETPNKQEEEEEEEEKKDDTITTDRETEMETETKEHDNDDDNDDNDDDEDDDDDDDWSAWQEGGMATPHDLLDDWSRIMDLERSNVQAGQLSQQSDDADNKSRHQDSLPSQHSEKKGESSTDNAEDASSEQVIEQSRPLPDEVHYPLALPREHFTVMLCIDNYQVMEKAIEMYKGWKDVREYFATLYRRPYLVHYALSAYLFKDILGEDLESYTDEQLWEKAKDVFWNRDETLSKDGFAPLRKHIDNVKQEAETKFYKNFKREEVLLTCEEWTSFFNQFDWDEMIEEMIQRHNVRVPENCHMTFSARQRRRGKNKPDAESEPNVKLDNVRQRAKDKGFEQVVDEDPDVPSLQDLLEGKYTYSPEEAPYDVNFIQAISGGQYKKKKYVATKEEEERMANTESDSNDDNNNKQGNEENDDNEGKEEEKEQGPSTVKELVYQKTRNLYVALTKDPQSGYTELFRTVIPSIMDTILLGPQSNGYYTPRPPRHKRRGLGYTTQYFRKELSAALEQLIPELVHQSRCMYKAQRNKFVQEQLAAESRAPSRDILAHEHYKKFSERCEKAMYELYSNNETMVCPLLTHSNPDRLAESMTRLLRQQHPWLGIFRIPAAFPSNQFHNLVNSFKRHYGGGGAGNESSSSSTQSILGGGQTRSGGNAVPMSAANTSSLT